MLRGFSKGLQATLKYQMKSNMNLSWYVPKANVDHTISGQWTAISTLDHQATTQGQTENSLTWDVHVDWKPLVTTRMPQLTENSCYNQVNTV